MWRVRRGSAWPIKDGLPHNRYRGLGQQGNGGNPHRPIGFDGHAGRQGGAGGQRRQAQVSGSERHSGLLGQKLRLAKQRPVALLLGDLFLGRGPVAALWLFFPAYATLRCQIGEPGEKERQQQTRGEAAGQNITAPRRGTTALGDKGLGIFGRQRERRADARRSTLRLFQRWRAQQQPTRTGAAGRPPSAAPARRIRCAAHPVDVGLERLAESGKRLIEKRRRGRRR